MNIGVPTNFGHRKAEADSACLKGGDDFLLIHDANDISIIATLQQQSCKMPDFSNGANSSDMTGLESDTALIRGLVEHTGLKPSRIAKEIGVAATTLLRPYNGAATTRLSQPTLEKLRFHWPDYAGWYPDAPSEAPAANAQVIPMEGASMERPQENLQVWGTALGAEREFDGEAVEQTTLNTGDIIEYVKRPTILNGKNGCYALYVQGSSMHPALPDGEMIVAVKDGPLSIGDNVVVYLRPQDDGDEHAARGVLVKELVRRTGSYVELRQYGPPKDFRVDMTQVRRIDRVLTRKEMLS